MDNSGSDSKLEFPVHPKYLVRDAQLFIHRQKDLRSALATVTQEGTHSALLPNSDPRLQE